MSLPRQLRVLVAVAPGPGLTADESTAQAKEVAYCRDFHAATWGHSGLFLHYQEVCADQAVPALAALLLDTITSEQEEALVLVYLFGPEQVVIPLESACEGALRTSGTKPKALVISTPRGHCERGEAEGNPAVDEGKREANGEKTDSSGPHVLSMGKQTLRCQGWCQWLAALYFGARLSPSGRVRVGTVSLLAEALFDLIGASEIGDDALQQCVAVQSPHLVPFPTGCGRILLLESYCEDANHQLEASRCRVSQAIQLSCRLSLRWYRDSPFLCDLGGMEHLTHVLHGGLRAIGCPAEDLLLWASDEVQRMWDARAPELWNDRRPVDCPVLALLVTTVPHLPANLPGPRCWLLANAVVLPFACRLRLMEAALSSTLAKDLQCVITNKVHTLRLEQRLGLPPNSVSPAGDSIGPLVMQIVDCASRGISPVCDHTEDRYFCVRWPASCLPLTVGQTDALLTYHSLVELPDATMARVGTFLAWGPLAQSPEYFPSLRCAGGIGLADVDTSRSFFVDGKCNVFTVTAIELKPKPKPNDLEFAVLKWASAPDPTVNFIDRISLVAWVPGIGAVVTVGRDDDVVYTAYSNRITRHEPGNVMGAVVATLSDSSGTIEDMIVHQATAFALKTTGEVHSVSLADGSSQLLAGLPEAKYWNDQPHRCLGLWPAHGPVLLRHDAMQLEVTSLLTKDPVPLPAHHWVAGPSATLWKGTCCCRTGGVKAYIRSSLVFFDLGSAVHTTHANALSAKTLREGNEEKEETIYERLRNIFLST